MSTEMHLCDGTWDSLINGTNNGIFEFTLDQQTGAFFGTHTYPDFREFDIVGECSHPGMGGVHKITIWEPITPEERVMYRYFGIITPNAGGAGRHKAKGKRHRIPRISNVALEVLRQRMSEEQLKSLVPDDWEADKAT